MKTSAEEPLLLVGCGILQKEIEFLSQKNNWALETQFADSMLHVDFHLLDRALHKMLDVSSNRRRLVFYGSCHPRMDHFLEQAQLTRVPGQNCVEMLLGSEKFRTDLEQGAYFLLEDWALRWNVMMHKLVGDHLNMIPAIFQEDRTHILALRTPCSGDFSALAETAAKQTGLELRWRDQPLDILENVLRTAMDNVPPQESL